MSSKPTTNSKNHVRKILQKQPIRDNANSSSNGGASKSQHAVFSAEKSRGNTSELMSKPGTKCSAKTGGVATHDTVIMNCESINSQDKKQYIHNDIGLRPHNGKSPEHSKPADRTSRNRKGQILPQPATCKISARPPVTLKATSPQPVISKAVSPQHVTRKQTSSQTLTRKVTSPQPTARKITSPQPVTRKITSSKPVTRKTISPQVVVQKTCKTENIVSNEESSNESSSKPHSGRIVSKDKSRSSTPKFVTSSEIKQSETICKKTCVNQKNRPQSLKYVSNDQKEPVTKSVPVESSSAKLTSVSHVKSKDSADKNINQRTKNKSFKAVNDNVVNRKSQSTTPSSVASSASESKSSSMSSSDSCKLSIKTKSKNVNKVENIVSKDKCNSKGHASKLPLTATRSKLSNKKAKDTVTDSKISVISPSKSINSTCDTIQFEAADVTSVENGLNRNVQTTVNSNLTVSKSTNKGTAHVKKSKVPGETRRRSAGDTTSRSLVEAVQIKASSSQSSSAKCLVKDIMHSTQTANSKKCVTPGSSKMDKNNIHSIQTVSSVKVRENIISSPAKETSESGFKHSDESSSTEAGCVLKQFRTVPVFDTLTPTQQKVQNGKDSKPHSNASLDRKCSSQNVLDSRNFKSNAHLLAVKTKISPTAQSVTDRLMKTSRFKMSANENNIDRSTQLMPSSAKEKQIYGFKKQEKYKLKTDKNEIPSTSSRHLASTLRGGIYSSLSDDSYIPTESNKLRIVLSGEKTKEVYKSEMKDNNTIIPQYSCNEQIKSESRDVLGNHREKHIYESDECVDMKIAAVERKNTCIFCQKQNKSSSAFDLQTEVKTSHLSEEVSNLSDLGNALLTANDTLSCTETNCLGISHSRDTVKMSDSNILDNISVICGNNTVAVGNENYCEYCLSRVCEHIDKNCDISQQTLNVISANATLELEAEVRTFQADAFKENSTIHATSNSLTNYSCDTGAGALFSQECQHSTVNQPRINANLPVLRSDIVSNSRLVNSNLRVSKSCPNLYSKQTVSSRNIIDELMNQKHKIADQDSLLYKCLPGKRITIIPHARSEADLICCKQFEIASDFEQMINKCILSPLNCIRCKCVLGECNCTAENGENEILIPISDRNLAGNRHSCIQSTCGGECADKSLLLSTVNSNIENTKYLQSTFGRNSLMHGNVNLLHFTSEHTLGNSKTQEDQFCDNKSNVGGTQISTDMFNLRNANDEKQDIKLSQQEESVKWKNLDKIFICHDADARQQISRVDPDVISFSSAKTDIPTSQSYIFSPAENIVEPCLFTKLSLDVQKCCVQNFNSVPTNQVSDIDENCALQGAAKMNSADTEYGNNCLDYIGKATSVTSEHLYIGQSEAQEYRSHQPDSFPEFSSASWSANYLTVRCTENSPLKSTVKTISLDATENLLLLPEEVCCELDLPLPDHALVKECLQTSEIQVMSQVCDLLHVGENNQAQVDSELVVINHLADISSVFNASVPEPCITKCSTAQHALADKMMYPIKSDDKNHRSANQEHNQFDNVISDLFQHCDGTYLRDTSNTKIIFDFQGQETFSRTRSYSMPCLTQTRTKTNKMRSNSVGTISETKGSSSIWHTEHFMAVLREKNSNSLEYLKQTNANPMCTTPCLPTLKELCISHLQKKQVNQTNVIIKTLQEKCANKMLSDSRQITEECSNCMISLQNVIDDSNTICTDDKLLNNNSSKGINDQCCMDANAFSPKKARIAQINTTESSVYLQPCSEFVDTAQNLRNSTHHFYCNNCSSEATKISDNANNCLSNYIHMGLIAKSNEKISVQVSDYMNEGWIKENGTYDNIALCQNARCDICGRCTLTDAQEALFTEKGVSDEQIITSSMSPSIENKESGYFSVDHSQENIMTQSHYNALQDSIESYSSDTVYYKHDSLLESDSLQNVSETEFCQNETKSPKCNHLSKMSCEMCCNASVLQITDGSLQVHNGLNNNMSQMEAVSNNSDVYDNCIWLLNENEAHENSIKSDVEINDKNYNFHIGLQGPTIANLNRDALHHEQAVRGQSNQIMVDKSAEDLMETSKYSDKNFGLSYKYGINRCRECSVDLYTSGKLNSHRQCIEFKNLQNSSGCLYVQDPYGDQMLDLPSDISVKEEISCNEPFSQTSNVCYNSSQNSHESFHEKFTSGRRSDLVLREKLQLKSPEDTTATYLTKDGVNGNSKQISYLPCLQNSAFSISDENCDTVSAADLDLLENNSLVLDGKNLENSSTKSICTDIYEAVNSNNSNTDLQSQILFYNNSINVPECNYDNVVNSKSSSENGSNSLAPQPVLKENAVCLHSTTERLYEVKPCTKCDSELLNETAVHKISDSTNLIGVSNCFSSEQQLSDIPDIKVTKHGSGATSKHLRECQFSSDTELAEENKVCGNVFEQTYNNNSGYLTSTKQENENDVTFNKKFICSPVSKDLLCTDADDKNGCKITSSIHSHGGESLSDFIFDEDVYLSETCDNFVDAAESFFDSDSENKSKEGLISLNDNKNNILYTGSETSTSVESFKDAIEVLDDDDIDVDDDDDDEDDYDTVKTCHHMSHWSDDDIFEIQNQNLSVHNIGCIETDICTFCQSESCHLCLQTNLFIPQIDTDSAAPTTNKECSNENCEVFHDVIQTYQDENMQFHQRRRLPVKNTLLSSGNTVSFKKHESTCVKDNSYLEISASSNADNSPKEHALKCRSSDSICESSLRINEHKFGSSKQSEDTPSQDEKTVNKSRYASGVSRNCSVASGSGIKNSTDTMDAVNSSKNSAVVEIVREGTRFQILRNASRAKSEQVRNERVNTVNRNLNFGFRPNSSSRVLNSVNVLESKVTAEKLTTSSAVGNKIETAVTIRNEKRRLRQVNKQSLQTAHQHVLHTNSGITTQEIARGNQEIGPNDQENFKDHVLVKCSEETKNVPSKNTQHSRFHSCHPARSESRIKERVFVDSEPSVNIITCKSTHVHFQSETKGGIQCKAAINIDIRENTQTESNTVPKICSHEISGSTKNDSIDIPNTDKEEHTQVKTCKLSGLMDSDAGLEYDLQQNFIYEDSNSEFQKQSVLLNDTQLSSETNDQASSSTHAFSESREQSLLGIGKRESSEYEKMSSPPTCMHETLETISNVCEREPSVMKNQIPAQIDTREFSGPSEIKNQLCSMATAVSLVDACESTLTTNHVSSLIDTNVYLKTENRTSSVTDSFEFAETENRVSSIIDTTKISEPENQYSSEIETHESSETKNKVPYVVDTPTDSEIKNQAACIPDINVYLNTEKQASSVTDTLESADTENQSTPVIGIRKSSQTERQLQCVVDTCESAEIENQAASLRNTHDSTETEYNVTLMTDTRKFSETGSSAMIDTCESTGTESQSLSVLDEVESQTSVVLDKCEPSVIDIHALSLVDTHRPSELENQIQSAVATQASTEAHTQTQPHVDTHETVNQMPSILDALELSKNKNQDSLMIDTQECSEVDGPVSHMSDTSASSATMPHTLNAHESSKNKTQASAPVDINTYSQIPNDTLYVIDTCDYLDDEAQVVQLVANNSSSDAESNGPSLVGACDTADTKNEGSLLSHMHNSTEEKSSASPVIDPREWLETQSLTIGLSDTTEVPIMENQPLSVVSRTREYLQTDNQCYESGTRASTINYTSQTSMYDIDQTCVTEAEPSARTDTREIRATGSQISFSNDICESSDANSQQSLLTDIQNSLEASQVDTCETLAFGKEPVPIKGTCESLVTEYQTLPLKESSGYIATNKEASTLTTDREYSDSDDPACTIIDTREFSEPHNQTASLTATHESSDIEQNLTHVDTCESSKSCQEISVPVGAASNNQFQDLSRKHIHCDLYDSSSGSDSQFSTTDSAENCQSLKNADGEILSVRIKQNKDVIHGSSENISVISSQNQDTDLCIKTFTVCSDKADERFQFSENSISNSEQRLSNKTYRELKYVSTSQDVNGDKDVYKYDERRPEYFDNSCSNYFTGEYIASNSDSFGTVSAHSVSPFYEDSEYQNQHSAGEDKGDDVIFTVHIVDSTIENSAEAVDGCSIKSQDNDSSFKSDENFAYAGIDSISKSKRFKDTERKECTEGELDNESSLTVTTQVDSSFDNENNKRLEFDVPAITIDNSNSLEGENVGSYGRDSFDLSSAVSKEKYSTNQDSKSISDEVSTCLPSDTKITADILGRHISSNEGLNLKTEDTCGRIQNTYWTVNSESDYNALNPGCIGDKTNERIMKEIVNENERASNIRQISSNTEIAVVNNANVEAEICEESNISVALALKREKEQLSENKLFSQERKCSKTRFRRATTAVILQNRERKQENEADIEFELSNRMVKKSKSFQIERLSEFRGQDESNSEKGNNQPSDTDNIIVNRKVSDICKSFIEKTKASVAEKQSSLKLSPVTSPVPPRKLMNWVCKEGTWKREPLDVQDDGDRVQTTPIIMCDLCPAKDESEKQIEIAEGTTQESYSHITEKSNVGTRPNTEKLYKNSSGSRQDDMNNMQVDRSWELKGSFADELPTVSVNTTTTGPVNSRSSTVYKNHSHDNGTENGQSDDILLLFMGEDIEYMDGVDPTEIDIPDSCNDVQRNGSKIITDQEKKSIAEPAVAEKVIKEELDTNMQDDIEQASKVFGSETVLKHEHINGNAGGLLCLNNVGEETSDDATITSEPSSYGRSSSVEESKLFQPRSLIASCNVLLSQHNKLEQSILNDTSCSIKPSLICKSDLVTTVSSNVDYKSISDRTLNDDKNGMMSFLHKNDNISNLKACFREGRSIDENVDVPKQISDKYTNRSLGETADTKIVDTPKTDQTNDDMKEMTSSVQNDDCRGPRIHTYRKKPIVPIPNKLPHGTQNLNTKPNPRPTTSDSEPKLDLISNKTTSQNPDVSDVSFASDSSIPKRIPKLKAVKIKEEEIFEGKPEYTKACNLNPLGIENDEILSKVRQLKETTTRSDDYSPKSIIQLQSQESADLHTKQHVPEKTQLSKLLKKSKTFSVLRDMQQNYDIGRSSYLRNAGSKETLHYGSICKIPKPQTKPVSKSKSDITNSRKSDNLSDISTSDITSHQAEIRETRKLSRTVSLPDNQLRYETLSAVKGNSDNTTAGLGLNSVSKSDITKNQIPKSKEKSQQIKDRSCERSKSLQRTKLLSEIVEVEESRDDLLQTQHNKGPNTSRCGPAVEPRVKRPVRRTAKRRSLSLPTGTLAFGEARIVYKNGHFTIETMDGNELDSSRPVSHQPSTCYSGNRESVTYQMPLYNKEQQVPVRMLPEPRPDLRREVTVERPQLRRQVGKTVLNKNELIENGDIYNIENVSPKHVQNRLPISTMCSKQREDSSLRSQDRLDQSVHKSRDEQMQLDHDSESHREKPVRYHSSTSLPDATTEEVQKVAQRARRTSSFRQAQEQGAYRLSGIEEDKDHEISRKRTVSLDESQNTDLNQSRISQSSNQNTSFFQRMMARRKSSTENLNLSTFAKQSDSAKDFFSKKISLKGLFRKNRSDSSGSSPMKSQTSSSPPVIVFKRDEDITSVGSAPSSPFSSKNMRRRHTSADLFSKAFKEATPSSQPNSNCSTPTGDKGPIFRSYSTPGKEANFIIRTDKSAPFRESNLCSDSRLTTPEVDEDEISIKSVSSASGSIHSAHSLQSPPLEQPHKPKTPKPVGTSPRRNPSSSSQGSQTSRIFSYRDRDKTMSMTSLESENSEIVFEDYNDFKCECENLTPTLTRTRKFSSTSDSPVFQQKCDFCVKHAAEFDDPGKVRKFWIGQDNFEDQGRLQKDAIGRLAVLVQSEISASNSNDSGIQHDVSVHSSSESLKGTPESKIRLRRQKSTSPRPDRPKSEIGVRWADLDSQEYDVASTPVRRRDRSQNIKDRPRPKSDFDDNIQLFDELFLEVLEDFETEGSSFFSDRMKAFGSEINLQPYCSLRNLYEMRRRDWESTQGKNRRMSTPHPIKSRLQRTPKRLQKQAPLVRSSSMPESLDKVHKRRKLHHLLDFHEASLSKHMDIDECLSDDSDLSFDHISLQEKSLSVRSSQSQLTSMDEEEDNLTYAEALWDHITMDPEELGFRAGDLINVFDMSDKDWWFGEIEDREGWFPAAFVRLRVNQDQLEDELEVTLQAELSTSPKLRRISTINKVQARSNVVNEIIGAEREYVKHLKDVVEGYIQHARKRHEMFSEERLSLIFGNIESIYSFAQKFLSQLEMCIDVCPHLSEIGQSFLDNKKGFEIYSDYCNNHPSACEELKELYKNAKYRHFFEACRLLQELVEIPLEGFLLTPVQKICKYPLQLAELLKYTPPEHADYSKVKEALFEMRKIATLINERKRKMESIEKIAAWQHTVVDWEGEDLLERSSELIFSGDINKVNSAGWSQERYFFLFDHQLIYCKKELLKRHVFSYKGRIDLDHCDIISIPDGKDTQYNVTVKHAWKLHETHKDKWYLLYTKTSSGKDRWLKALADERKRVREDQENDFCVPEHWKQTVLNKVRSQSTLKEKQHSHHRRPAPDSHLMLQKDLNSSVPYATLPRVRRGASQKPEKKKGWSLFGGKKSKR